MTEPQTTKSSRSPVSLGAKDHNMQLENSQATLTEKTKTTKKKHKEVLAWSIALEGRPCPYYMAHTRKDAIEAFNNNIVQPPPQSSEPRKTIKDYKLYKPVKVAIRVIS